MARKRTGHAPARNEARSNAAVELRRSNAAVPIPSGTIYRRRPKHRADIDSPL